MNDIINNYFKEFKSGTKKMFKEFFNKETNKKQRANMWTFLRLITPLITLVLSISAIISGISGLLIASGVVAGMGALTDKFDGASARKHNSYTEYGKVLDQITDKSFAGIIGINLLFLNPNYILVLLGELAISIVNISYKIKYKKLNINSTLMGKIKQTPLFLSLALGFLSTINPTLLTLANMSVILTVITQLATTISYIEANKKNVRNLIKEDTIKYIEELNFEEETDNQNENEKTLTKSIESKTTKSITRKEHCEELKKIREEILRQDVEKVKERALQKTIGQTK